MHLKALGRWAVPLFSIGGALLWAAAAYRVLPIVVAVVLVIGAFVHLVRRTRPKLTVYASALALCLLPLDITFVNYPGPPRFIPVVMGLPGPRLLEDAHRNRVVLGGCVVRGYEPWWVLIW